MYEAIAQVASGESLTRSAHMAGFADSSYFCRIYKARRGPPDPLKEVIAPHSYLPCEVSASGPLVSAIDSASNSCSW